MITRYQCALDGISLHTLDNAITITDIQEYAPVMRLTTAARARYEGTLVTRRARQSLSVTVRFLIREYDVARRKAVMQKISAWAARGKYLTVGDRPDQQLRVSVEGAPVITSALKWTEELSVTFTAYAIPYWQAATPTEVTVAAAASSGTVTLTPAGDAPQCFLEADAVNRGSGTMNSLTFSVNGTTIAFQGLATAVGGAVSLTYDDSGLLVLPTRFRTAQSSDDLLLVPGQSNTVTFSADQPITVLFRARGLYQ